MKFNKCFKHALEMVIHSKLRSWLTIIGIVIGVAAVVAIVSLGEGMQQELNYRMGALGGDIITVTAGFSRGGNMFEQGGEGGQRGGSQATTKAIVLNNMDLQALRGVSNIAVIETEIKGNVPVSYLGRNGSVSLKKYGHR
jgi:putative ABC transport system permease protein